MAAYRADIEIGVKGVQYLDKLKTELTQVAKAIDAVNSKEVVVRRTIAGAASAVPMGPGGAGVTGASAQAAAMAVERRVSEMRRTEAQAAIKSVRDRAMAENYISGVIARRLQQKEQELQVEKAITAEATKQATEKLKSRAGGAISSALIGGGFPLLFGQGGGAAAGGALGGLAGGLLGGGFGFALSIVGTALGQAADDADKFNKTLGQLNSTVSGTTSATKVTAQDIDKLATNLGIAKDEALKLLSAFAGFSDAKVTKALVAVYGEDPGTLQSLAAVKDKADLAEVILDNYEKITLETASQLINQLKTTDSATVQIAFQKALLDAEIKKTEEGLKQVKIQDRILAGLASIGSLSAGGPVIDPSIFGQQRVEEFRKQQPPDVLQNALKALGVLQSANRAVQSLRPDTKAASAADKAARDAEREAERVEKALRTRQLNRLELQRQFDITQEIFTAETAKNTVLARELEGKYELVRIGIETARLLEEEKNSRVQLAIAREMTLKRDYAILKTELDITKIVEERGEKFSEIITDLDQELALRKATTQAERDRLTIEYEMQKLRKDKVFDETQLLAIEDKKKQLATPITGVDIVKQQVGTLSDELTKITDAGNQVNVVAEAVGLSFANSFNDVITGAVSAQQTLANFFQRIADSFLDMAAQIIAKMIQIQILNAALGLFGGGGAAGAVSSDPVSQFLSGVAQYRAEGGSVMGGSPYIVGERGPELFVPGRSGTIVPNNQLGAGGSTSVTVNVDASGSSVEGNEQGANQLGKAIGLAVQQELIKQKRPGGLLAGV